ncbi:MAG: MATE family efflux transporter [Halanaerobiales bacterium]|nr:MATE family efflux transporter [Halanaerobiales bacterium]
MDLLQKQDLILKGNMKKVIITLSLPIMLSNLIQTIYNLTDTFWVGRLGANEVASIVLIWPVIFFFMSFGAGVNIAGTALISQYIGSQRKKEATQIAGQILSFSALFSIVFGLAGFFLSHSLVSLMGGKGEILQLATGYLKIIFSGMPFMFLFFAFNSIKQGQGDTVTPMVIGAISVGLNIILDPIFIFKFGLGVNGAAYATLLSRAIFTIYAVYTLFIHDNGIRLKKSDLMFNKELIKIIKIGLPTSIGQSMSALGFGLLNAFIISYGSNTLAAFGIGNRINSLVLMPAMGIGSALATVIGQNLGANQIQRAKKAVRQSVLLNTVMMVCGSIIMFLLSSLIIQQFTNDPEVRRQATEYLRLISLVLPFVGYFQIFIGTFQGSGHTVSAMILMMGRLWGLRIPMILLFKYFTNWGSSAIWYAMILSNLLICVIGLGIYSTGNWQQKVIKKKTLNLDEKIQKSTG